MAKILTDAKPEAERKSYNGQTPRTEGEERDAHRRRLRRWHKKAVAALGVEVIREILVEAQGYSKADTENEPAR